MSGNGRFEAEASVARVRACPRLGGGGHSGARATQVNVTDKSRDRAHGKLWVGVEVRHLAALEAIEAERSFHGAADRLGYVQSAVSQQLSTLEALVGVRLVERASGHSGIELTHAGQVLLEHSVKILRQLSAARAELQALGESGCNTLRVGGFQRVMTHLLPPVLGRLARQSPQLRVILTESPTDGDLFDPVRRGELDFAFADLPLNPGPFEAVELIVDPFVLLVPNDSPLATCECPLTLTDLVTVPVAMPSWRMSQLVDPQFRAVEREPKHTFCVENDTTVHALVRAGIGAGLLPRLAADPLPPGTVLRELEGVPARTLVLYWHRDRVVSAPMEAFIDAVRSVSGELALAQSESQRHGSAPAAVRWEDACAAGAEPELAA